MGKDDNNIQSKLTPALTNANCNDCPTGLRTTMNSTSCTFFAVTILFWDTYVLNKFS